jgi:hypothetical protein
VSGVATDGPDNDRQQRPPIEIAELTGSSAIWPKETTRTKEGFGDADPDQTVWVDIRSRV